MRHATPLRTLAYAALASGLLLTTACHRAEVVADDVTSAQDAGLGDEENAATTDLVDAAPQDAAAAASTTVADATELQGLLSGCAKRSYDAASRLLTPTARPARWSPSTAPATSSATTSTWAPASSPTWAAVRLT